MKTIGRIQNCLSDESATIIVHASITKNFDYCNSPLYSYPDFQIQRLKIIKNIVARILTKYKRNSHITPILFHIRFKIFVLTFQASTGCTFKIRKLDFQNKSVYRIV